MSRYKSKFDLIFLSVSNTTKMANIRPCLKVDGLVIAETAKYVLDLNKEQVGNHLNLMKQIAKENQLVEKGLWFLLVYVLKVSILLLILFDN